MDRDTIIDLVATVDTEFAKLEVGTYNGFDIYERFALYVEAIVRAEEREACAKVCDVLSVDRGMIDDETLKTGVFSGAIMCAAAIRTRGQR